MVFRYSIAVVSSARVVGCPTNNVSNAGSSRSVCNIDPIDAIHTWGKIDTVINKILNNRDFLFCRTATNIFNASLLS